MSQTNLINLFPANSETVEYSQNDLFETCGNSDQFFQKSYSLGIHQLVNWFESMTGTTPIRKNLNTAGFI